MSPEPRKPRLTLQQRFNLLRRFNRLQRETETLLEEVREAEIGICGYCGEARQWSKLTDESTQTEQRPMICDKCIERRKVAYDGGWHTWPNRM